MTPQGVQVSTPTDTSIVLIRAFQAPRRLVWEAMFEPAKMRRWMCSPPGMAMTVCECEARAGGALSLAWKNDDADPFMTLQGVFTDVVLHEWATHTEKMALGSGQIVGSQLETHAFAEQGGVTTMHITQEYPSKEERDGAIASGMDEGMEAGYKQLDAMLAQPA